MKKAWMFLAAGCLTLSMPAAENIPVSVNVGKTHVYRPQAYSFAQAATIYNAQNKYRFIIYVSISRFVSLAKQDVSFSTSYHWKYLRFQSFQGVIIPFKFPVLKFQVSFNCSGVKSSAARKSQNEITASVKSASFNEPAIVLPVRF